ncbi:MAG: hypothetical protein RL148_1258 [Planctomycetota bacterium]
MKAILPGLLFVLAAPLFAQEDKVTLTSGEVLDGCKVQSFDIRELKYVPKNGGATSVGTDRVAKVELAKFADTYRRGVSSKDGNLYMPVARDLVGDKNVLMAQLGFVAAANAYLDAGMEAEAFGALDELQKAIPEAGTVADVYRLKFETYAGRGPRGGQNAMAVAKKYQADATTGAWPQGLQVEAEFLVALAGALEGSLQKPAFQSKLREIVARAAGSFPLVANRANVQLANSLRETKDLEGARAIYTDLMGKESVDDNTLAGAYLGLGMLDLESGDASKKEVFKEALLKFLRVRVVTKDSWPSLQAEALYHAILAADKWGGEDSRLISGRCRYILMNEYPNSEWAERAKNK